MKTFFTKFKRSLYDSAWYKEVSREEHPVKLSYALILALLSSLVAVIFITVALYSVGVPAAKEFVNSQIPENLVVEVKSDQVSINQPVPYRFELPGKEKKDGKVNFLVIDTNVSADLNSTKKYETYAFVSKDTVIIEKESGEIRAYPLKDVPDFTVSRAIANDLLEKVVAFAWLVPIVIFIPIAFFSFLGLLLTFILAGFLLWIVMKIASRSIRFKNAFAVAMYAYTFVFIVDLVLGFIHGGFNFFITALLIVLISLIFLFKRDEHPTIINEAQ